MSESKSTVGLDVSESLHYVQYNMCVCVCTHLCVCIAIHTYTYIEREKKRERNNREYSQPSMPMGCTSVDSTIFD